MDNNQIQFMESNCIKKIQKWWRTRSAIKALSLVHKYLTESLSNEDLQDLSNKVHSIKQKCKGDGAGLSKSALIDMFLCEFLKKKLTNYSEYHVGESDMKICDISLSLKHASGKSQAALNWSKNEKNEEKKTKIEKEHFNTHMMIIVSETNQWWKKRDPVKKPKLKINYSDVIQSGIYFVDKQFCKSHVELKSNNKTNSLIEPQYLYIMLKRSISQNLFLSLPSPNKNLKFNILNAFSE
jgi:hypothetical protein